MANLLLLPGLLCDARLWRDVIAALPPGTTSIAADLSQDENIAGMAARALTLVDGPVVVAGLSMGGYVALEIARTRPDRLAGLCLLDTSARPDSVAQAKRRRLAMAASSVGRFRGISRRLLKQLLHPDNLTDSALCADVLAMAGRFDRASYLHQQRAILARPDQRDWLPRLRVPSLVISGAADIVTPPVLGEELATLIPGARFCLVPGAGHLPPMERPAVVTRLIAGLLRDASLP